MKVVEYWHGTIKNYRYDGDVSTASYGKVIYMDCLCLVEMINFDIKIVPIQVRMQKLETSERSSIERQKMTRPTRRHVSWVVRV